MVEGEVSTIPAAPARGSPPTFVDRRDRVRERLGSTKADAFVVLSPVNIRYLTGFTGSAGVLAVFAESPDHLVTDGRYDPQAEEEVDEKVAVEFSSDPALEAMQRKLERLEVARAAFEAEHASVAQWREWRERGAPELEPVEDWVEKLREIKAEHEIDAIRRAARIVDDALVDVLPFVRPGVAEREIAAELVHLILSRGAERIAFDPVVAFGERSALPHARPSARTLESGELVLLDLGAVVDGYCSDISRTVACGDPGPELREAYAVVRDAQGAALEGIRGGLGCREADALAREPIEAAGRGEAFRHSLGHGLGLEVHEGPRLSKKSDDELAPNMVVTVEPGVYIAGRGGVRIEDDVVVASDGVEVLTGAPKDDLLVL